MHTGGGSLITRKGSSGPRLSIGLPVYNGDEYLAEAVDALLGQTFSDFELIISDNASTDGTEEICRDFAAHDPRVRYVRQPTNVGCGPNHNCLVHLARGEFFKWASDDDLYARELLQRCMDVLDDSPDVILSHSWTAIIDSQGAMTTRAGYNLRTDSPDPATRFRSLLFDVGGDDDYGVIRTAVLKRTALYDSYWHADRTLVAELALHGRFRQVPEPLFFRRDHLGSLSRERSVRQWCTSQDPRRADRLRHPLPRLLAEYPLGYVKAIFRAPLSTRDRGRCLAALGEWAVSRAVPWRFGKVPPVPYEALKDPTSVGGLVARRPRSA